MMISRILFLSVCVFTQFTGLAQQELKIYSDSMGFYNFNYPPSFEIKKLGPAAVQITSVLNSPTDKFAELLTIQVSLAPENISTDSLSSLLLRNMQMKYLVAKDLRHEIITISGNAGRKISMTVMDKQLVSISESFALIKGLLIRLSYQNEFQSESSDVTSFTCVFESLKTNW